jgi:WD40 repeat protein
MKTRILRVGIAATLLLTMAIAFAERSFAQGRPDIEIVPNLADIGRIYAVAFSPDGKLALSGSAEQSLKLWDVATGRRIRSFQASGLWSADFTANGTRIVSANSDTIQVWDALTAKNLRTIELPKYSTHSVAVSPDGRRAISAGHDKLLKLWDLETGQLLRTFQGHTESVLTVAFSPDGKHAASGGEDHKIMLWDVDTGELLHAFVGNYQSIDSLAYSPDGTRLLSGDSDGEIKLWDAATGELLRSFGSYYGQLAPWTSVAYSRDGKLVAAGCADNKVRLWQAETGELLRTFEGHTDDPFAVAISPDGRQVLSGSFDSTMKLWDVASGQLVRTFAGTAALVDSVAVSPDGKLLLSASRDKLVRLWDLTTGALIRIFEGHAEWVRRVAFSPDGTKAASGDFKGVIKLWDVATGQLLRTYDTHSIGISSLAFSHDGRHIVSADGDNKVRLWDTSWTWFASSELDDNATWDSGVAYSADGKLIAEGTRYGIEIWDAAKRRLLQTLSGHHGNVTSVAFSSDGRLLVSGSEDNSVKLWKVATGEEIRTFQGHTDWVESVAFLPDDSAVISASSDKSLKLWDVATGQLLQTFSGHTGIVESVAITPDGRHAVSGGADAFIKIWDIDTGEPSVSLIGSGTTEWAAVTAEGFFAASDKGAEALSAVRGVEVYSIDQFFQSLYRPDLVRWKLSDEQTSIRVKEAAQKIDLEKVLNSGAAPTITIASPTNGTEIGDPNVEVAANLENQGGGIGRVEWRINGITTGVQNLRVEAPGKIQVKRSFALGEGTNVIQLVAYNFQNLIASLPASVTLKAIATTPRPPPQLYVLAVGVNEYREKSLKLKFADGDAKSIAAAFAKQDSGVGLYSGVHVSTLLDGQVTLNGLRAAFDDLSKVVRPEDVFVMYLAGHGVTEDGRYFYVPQDASHESYASLLKTAINQDQLQEWLTEIPALRSVLIYDTCESGSIAEEQSGFRVPQRLVAVEKLSQSIGRTVLAATGDTGSALEGYKGHGIFTYVFLDGLAFSDVNNDQRIEVSELGNYLVKKLPEVSATTEFYLQSPEVKVVGADFPLVNRSTISEIDALR